MEGKKYIVLRDNKVGVVYGSRESAYYTFPVKPQELRSVYENGIEKTFKVVKVVNSK